MLNLQEDICTHLWVGYQTKKYKLYEIEIFYMWMTRIRNFLQDNSKYFVISGLSYPATIAYISIPFLPDILDIVAPLNESRMRHLPFLVEYFLDEQKYFYPILLHIIVTIIIGVTTVVATETLTFAYIYHVCGMFNIVR